jgi:hypothetical protein
LRYDVIALVIFAFVGLLAIYRRDQTRQRRQRSSFFDDCLNIFERAEIRENGAHFPVLQGKYQGFDVKVEPIVDDLTVRKIPSLWLKICLIAPVPCAGVVDILIRPRGGEFYSSIYDFETELKRPQGWPKDVLIRCSDPQDAPCLSVLDPFLHFLNDPRCKEVLIAPGGIKILYQASQAQRAEYSVLRHTKFGAAPLARDTARQLVDILCSIYQTVLRPQTLATTTFEG